MQTHQKYVILQRYHLLKSADITLRLKVVALCEDANLLLEKVKMELSVQEENFVRQSLATREILSQKY